MLIIYKLLKYITFFIIFLVLFISIFFIPLISNGSLNFEYDNTSEIIAFNPTGFVWPLPGYTSISSYFVKRTSTTSGAYSSHSGIDIPAPPGTKFIAVNDGEITFTQFLGAGGYTITLSFDNIRVTYCHCNPNFIVKVVDIVKQGQVIGSVGPKNVYGVKGNQYKDENGNPTNGATTGPHLHLGIRLDGKYQNPLNYF